MRKYTIQCSIAAFVLTAALCPSYGQKEPRSSEHESPIPAEQRIDINHATLEQLLKLHGMTQIWAARIVRFRPYHAKNDLIDRGIVPAAVYARFSDFIIAHRDAQ